MKFLFVICGSIICGAVIIVLIFGNRHRPKEEGEKLKNVDDLQNLLLDFGFPRFRSCVDDPDPLNPGLCFTVMSLSRKQERFTRQRRFSSNYKTAIGADFSLKTIDWNDKTRINLQLWDIAGHERFGYMTRVYYKHATAAVVVFDLTRTATTQSVTQWLKDLRGKVRLADGSPIPLVLLANKCDVDNCAVPTDLIHRLCKEYQIDAWFTTSAKENTNIDETFRFLVQRSLQIGNYSHITSENILLNNKPIFDAKVYRKHFSCCQ